jgi:hypothetical protein
MAGNTTLSVSGMSSFTAAKGTSTTNYMCGFEKTDDPISSGVNSS